MWLDEEEQLILKYLKDSGEAGASAREICRKASTKEAWKKNDRWAYKSLGSLKDKKLVDMTPAGNYRLPVTQEEEDEKRRKEGKV